MEKGRKEKKVQAVWPGFAAGLLAAAGLYLLGLLFLALLLTKGTVSEGKAFPVVAALCILSALCGGLLSVRKTAWRAAGLLTGAIFALVLLSVGLAAWKDGITWLGRGGILLLCAFGGGFAASLLGGRRRRKRK